jgi:hypothetical protein
MGFFGSVLREARAPLPGRDAAASPVPLPAIPEYAGEAVNAPSPDEVFPAAAGKVLETPNRSFQKEGREPREVPSSPGHRREIATGVAGPLWPEFHPSGQAVERDLEASRDSASVVESAEPKESDLETGRKETKPESEADKPRVAMFSRSLVAARESRAVLPTYAIEASEIGTAKEASEFQRGTEEERLGRIPGPGTPSDQIAPFNPSPGAKGEASAPYRFHLTPSPEAKVERETPTQIHLTPPPEARVEAEAPSLHALKTWRGEGEMSQRGRGEADIEITLAQPLDGMRNLEKRIDGLSSEMENQSGSRRMRPPPPAPQSPIVRIGQVEVFVTAPSRSAPAAPAGNGDRSLASRRYLRRA